MASDLGADLLATDALDGGDDARDGTTDGSGPDAVAAIDVILDMASTPDGSVPTHDITTVDAIPPDLPPADTALAADAGSIPSGFVALKAGTFMMGSPAAENCRYPNEELHAVTLTRGFLIGRAEVSRARFLAKMGFDPSTANCSGSSCPIDSVTWSLAAGYCNALSAAENLTKCYSCSGIGGNVSCTATSGSIYACKGYRLPTEAEWEYAYRAGTTTPTYLGALMKCVDDVVADKLGWYSRNSSGLQPSSTLGPNAWKLYGMAGNLMEFCHDVYVDKLGTAPKIDPSGPASGTGHALRGGAWGYQARSLRAAWRISTATASKGHFIGFRCARTYP